MRNIYRNGAPGDEVRLGLQQNADAKRPLQVVDNDNYGNTSVTNKDVNLPKEVCLGHNGMTAAPPEVYVLAFPAKMS